MSKLIGNFFCDISLFWFIRLHSDYEVSEGNCKKVAFHSDLYDVGEMPVEAMKPPSDALSEFTCDIDRQ